MSQRHYDIIILGGGFSARIAAALLAKGGFQVLTFRGPGETIPEWLFPSRHLENFLDILGGRSCVTSPFPFQVITAGERLDIHGRHPLEEELRREFPSSHERIESRLATLRGMGEKLEKILLESRGLPLLGLGSRMRFALRSFRHGLSGRIFRRSLGDFLLPSREEPFSHFLSALFAGLSLNPFERLSVAEGALLWNGAVRQEGVSRSGLDDLLRRRYEQYGGQTSDLSRIQSLHGEGTRLAGLTLKEGSRLGADIFLIGSSAANSLLPPKIKDRIPSSNPFRFLSTPLKGEPSPLLAPGLILGEDRTPLRVTFSGGDDGVSLAVDIIGRSGSEQIQRRLKKVLPFTDFQLEKEDRLPENAAEERGTRGPTQPITNLYVGKNVLLARGDIALPSLGGTGEVFAAATLSNHLLNRAKKV